MHRRVQTTESRWGSSMIKDKRKCRRWCKSKDVRCRRCWGHSKASKKPLWKIRWHSRIERDWSKSLWRRKKRKEKRKKKKREKKMLEKKNKYQKKNNEKKEGVEQTKVVWSVLFLNFNFFLFIYFFFFFEKSSFWRNTVEFYVYCHYYYYYIIISLCNQCLCCNSKNKHTLGGDYVILGLNPFQLFRAGGK